MEVEKKRGITLHRIPAIRIRFLKTRLPQRSFDYLVLTSKHALSRKELWKIRAKEIVCLGAQTAAQLGIRGARVVVLTEQNSAGLLKYFRRQRKRFAGKRNPSIFLPRSMRADPMTVRALRQSKYQVTAMTTYVTELLNVRRPVERILKKYPSPTFFLTSPSVVQALKQSFGIRRMRALAAELDFIAIGPTTRNYSESLGFKVRVAKTPSGTGLLKALLV